MNYVGQLSKGYMQIPSKKVCKDMHFQSHFRPNVEKLFRFSTEYNLNTCTYKIPLSTVLLKMTPMYYTENFQVQIM